MCGQLHFPPLLLRGCRQPASRRQRQGHLQQMRQQMFVQQLQHRQMQRQRQGGKQRCGKQRRKVKRDALRQTMQWRRQLEGRPFNFTISRRLWANILMLIYMVAISFLVVEAAVITNLCGTMGRANEMGASGFIGCICTYSAVPNWVAPMECHGTFVYYGMGGCAEGHTPEVLSPDLARKSRCASTHSSMRSRRYTCRDGAVQCTMDRNGNLADKGRGF